jgi:hypothetical protein
MPRLSRGTGGSRSEHAARSASAPNRSGGLRRHSPQRAARRRLAQPARPRGTRAAARRHRHRRGCFRLLRRNLSGPGCNAGSTCPEIGPGCVSVQPLTFPAWIRPSGTMRRQTWSTPAWPVSSFFFLLYSRAFPLGHLMNATPTGANHPLSCSSDRTAASRCPKGKRHDPTDAPQWRLLSSSCLAAFLRCVMLSSRPLLRRSSPPPFRPQSGPLPLSICSPLVNALSLNGNGIGS